MITVTVTDGHPAAGRAQQAVNVNVRCGSHWCGNLGSGLTVARARQCWHRRGNRDQDHGRSHGELVSECNFAGISPLRLNHRRLPPSQALPDWPDRGSLLPAYTFLSDESSGLSRAAAPDILLNIYAVGSRLGQAAGPPRQLPKPAVIANPSTKLIEIVSPIPREGKCIEFGQLSSFSSPQKHPLLVRSSEISRATGLWARSRRAAITPGVHRKRRGHGHGNSHSYRYRRTHAKITRCTLNHPLLLECTPRGRLDHSGGRS